MYLSLEHPVPVRHLSFMATTTDDDDLELQRLGVTLRNLRERAGMSQEEAATAIEALGGGKRGSTFTSQAYGPYERGRAEGLRKPSTQSKFAEALGFTRQDFLFEYQKLSGLTPAPAALGLADRSATFDAQPPAPTGKVTITDDLLSPWASSGTVAVYNLTEWPRPGEGVVLVPTAGGPPQVKIYDRADAETLHVRELNPPRTIALSRADFTAFRVVARLN